MIFYDNLDIFVCTPYFRFHMAHCFSFASFPKLPKTAILFLFVTYFISNTLYAQKAKQDSLEQVLDKRNLSTGERIAEGLTSSQIADKLFISTHTVDSHRKNLMEKFETNSIAVVIKLATEYNLF